jgi:hypothetical protein
MNRGKGSRRRVNLNRLGRETEIKVKPTQRQREKGNERRGKIKNKHERHMSFPKIYSTSVAKTSFRR